MAERELSRERLRAQYDCSSLLARAGAVHEGIVPVLDRAATHLEATRAEVWVPGLAGEIRRAFSWNEASAPPRERAAEVLPLGEGAIGGRFGQTEPGSIDDRSWAQPVWTDGEPAALLIVWGPERSWASDPELHGFVHALADQLSGFFQRCQLQDDLLEREKLAALGTAAAMFAHEVGNPLNNMFLQAQLLERRLRKAPEQDPVRAGMSGIIAEIRRLNALLQEFRSLARRRPMTFESVDLLGLLSEVVAAYVPTAVVRVDWDLPVDLPAVVGDRDKLVQVFLNLCKNAVEAMPEGGTLGFSGCCHDGVVTIGVADSGIGLAAGVDVFELFKTTKPQGTGLGLPVVRQIVSAHGGTVQADNGPAGGAVFSVSLPAVEPRPPA
jgi:signal transduction histidine kinase